MAADGRPVWLRHVAGSALFVIACSSLVQFGVAQVDLASSICGNKFRILFHVQEPFVMVNQRRCNATKCPPEAFQPDGGLTYHFMEDHVKPRLQQLCAEEGAASTDVEFDWYMPPDEVGSATAAVEMVCQGGFKRENQYDNEQVYNCPAESNYLGPSPVGTCDYASDPSCVSPGPDLVVGAISITRERLDKLDFSFPYYALQQVTVKRASSFELDVAGYLNIFQPFSGMLWLAIFLEILVVWLAILLVEAGVNDQIEGGWDALYDSFYWSLGSAFDPGGPGKAPVTVGGRIIMVGHWFFLTIVASTYVGAIGAFLTTSSSQEKIEGFFSLQTGSFGVAVPGPSFDSSVEAPRFRGTWMGGNSDTNTSQSLQFRLLQNTMEASGGSVFSIYTVRNIQSTFFGGESAVDATKDDPCTLEGVTLGAFDMLACKAGDGKKEPQALIVDAPTAVFEIMRRRNATGRCDLVTVGSNFNPSGYGIGFPKTALNSVHFSRAILGLLAEGVVEQLQDRYQLKDTYNVCSEDPLDIGLVITVSQIAGLFILALVGLSAAAVHGKLTRDHCPHPRGHVHVEYEEDAEWDLVPEDGLRPKMIALQSDALRIEELAARYADAVTRNKPFEWKPKRKRA